eukprot:jgi/Sobl393_1/1103/SZX72057.1
MQPAAQCWYAIPTSTQPCPTWPSPTILNSHQLESSLCQFSPLHNSSNLPAAAATAAACDLWGLHGNEPGHDSASSLSGSSAGKGVACNSAGSTAATTDTVMNVLLLLGSGDACSRSASGACPTSRTLDGNSTSTSWDQCQESTPAASSGFGAGVGCPPNAPARRRPPVMLLPAEELPGLLLAA